METRQIITKAFIMVGLICGMQTTASAQLGGVLNKAKSAVKSKVKNATEEVKEKATSDAKKEAANAKSKVLSKGLQKALGDAPDCPWVLDEKATEAQMENLIKQLGSMNSEKTKAFGEQISARAEFDKKILDGMKNKTLPHDDGVWDKAYKEMQKFEKFYGILINKGIGYGPTNIKKDDQGNWCQEGAVRIIIGNNAYVTIKNDKPVFCTLAYDAIFLDEEGIKKAQEAYRFNINSAWLLEGFPKTYDESLEQSYYRASFAANTIGHAIVNNKPENIERRDRPKAGSMNGAWRAKALALAKQKDSNVTDVVITSNEWDVKRNSLGVPINRVIYGYIFFKDKNGTKASSRSWDQKHQGGGKYGGLLNHGVGVETDFYVK